MIQAFGGNRTSGPIDVAPALNACGTASGRQDFETEAFITTHTLRGEGFDASEDGTGRGTPLVPVSFKEKMSTPSWGIDQAQTLQALNFEAVASVAHAPAVTFRDTADCLTSAYGTKWNGNASADNGSLYARHAMQVRRLTPVECERLQGFPDGYTAIPWRNKPASECPDGPRYKALGNSWAVPVVRWIGERINLVESVLEQQEVAA